MESLLWKVGDGLFAIQQIMQSAGSWVEKVHSEGLSFDQTDIGMMAVAACMAYAVRRTAVGAYFVGKYAAAELSPAMSKATAAILSSLKYHPSELTRDILLLLESNRDSAQDLKVPNGYGLQIPGKIRIAIDDGAIESIRLTKVHPWEISQDLLSRREQKLIIAKVGEIRKSLIQRSREELIALSIDEIKRIQTEG